ncbi:DNA repair and recombination protein RadB [Thermoplasma sp. Kam2015]|uniref:DNA repair and recombination protein RadB n=1 Tax=Thermoplasma sp. Kam2015 TaxID=2094122 RepID=UPI000D835C68|nr:DNA repair and recombination protein RadB [Thermoplasma sp. Kam2015]PYB68137.1 DNA repair and recombination protein RadB [Thermoplasma sp. Kam2015]
MDEVSLEQGIRRLTTGVNCIDAILNGGLEGGIITEVFGEGGSGKTNICMVASCSALSQGLKVVYIDSEGLSPERFLAVCHSDISRFKLFRVYSLDDQEVAIMKASKMADKDQKIGLIILDSFSEFFRLERSDDRQSRIVEFQRQLSLLSSLAAKRNIPVLITNQIYQDIDNGTLQPFGGFLVDHAMKAILKVEKLPDGRRKISITKHRSVKEGLSAFFRITDGGLTCEV